MLQGVRCVKYLIYICIYSVGTETYANILKHLFDLNRVVGYVELQLKSLRALQCTPAPVANAKSISTRSEQPRRLRKSGTSSLCIGYNFVEKKYDGVNVRPKELSIIEEFENDDDIDVEIDNKSNIYSVSQPIQYRKKNELQCEVEYPTNEKKKKKKSSSNVKPSLTLQDRPSDDLNLSESESENEDKAKRTLRLKREKNKRHRDLQRDQCMTLRLNIYAKIHGNIWKYMQIYTNIYIYIDLNRNNNNRNKNNNRKKSVVMDDVTESEDEEQDDYNNSQDSMENEEDIDHYGEEEEHSGDSDESRDYEDLGERKKKDDKDDSTSDDEPILGKPTDRTTRLRMNKERQRRSGMYRSVLEPKDDSNTPSGKRYIRKTHIRHKIIDPKHFPYFDIFETFASKRLSIKNKNVKLSVKCHTGFTKNQQCNVYSNGSELYAVGAKDHFDIIHTPRARCKQHKKKIRIFHYTKDEQRLYLGPGDEVVWSDGGQYEFYTLVPFKETQTYYKAHNQFSLRYNVNSVVLTVMLFVMIIIVIIGYLLIFVDICCCYYYS